MQLKWDWKTFTKIIVIIKGKYIIKQFYSIAYNIYSVEFCYIEFPDEQKEFRVIDKFKELSFIKNLKKKWII